MINGNSVVEFTMKDIDSYLRSSLRKNIITALCFAALSLWFGFSAIHFGQNPNDIVAMIFALIFNVVLAAAAYNSWQLWQNAAAESLLVRKSPNPGIKISTDKISILAILLDESARKVLFKQQKVSLDLNWSDIQSITVKDSDEGSDRVSEVSLGKDNLAMPQRYGLKNYEFWIQRKPFSERKRC